MSEAGMTLGGKEYKHKVPEKPPEPNNEHEEFVDSQFVQFLQANGAMFVLPLSYIALEERRDQVEIMYLVWFTAAGTALAVSEETFESLRGLLHAIRGVVAIEDKPKESDNGAE